VCFNAILSVIMKVTIPSHRSRWPPLVTKLIIKKKVNTTR